MVDAPAGRRISRCALSSRLRVHVAERIIHVYLFSREVNARELIRLNKINSSYTEARGRQSGEMFGSAHKVEELIAS